MNRRRFLTQMAMTAAGSLLIPAVAPAQWFGEESTATDDLEGWPSWSLDEGQPDSNVGYVPENAHNFLCTFDLANHAYAARRMEEELRVGRNGMVICPSGSSSYGSYFSGSRLQALEALVKEAGVRQDRIVTKEMPGTRNAAAVLCEASDGEIRQLVIWDPNFLSELDRKAGTEWASVAVLAHELAHHLNNDTGQNPGRIPPHERRQQELYADRYAGQKLRQFGASREDAIAVFREMGSGGESHPPSWQRVEAAGEGWDSASAQPSTPSTPSTSEGSNYPSTTSNAPSVTPVWATGCMTNYGYCMWVPGMTPAQVGQICYCPSQFGLIPGIAQ